MAGSNGCLHRIPRTTLEEIRATAREWPAGSGRMIYELRTFYRESPVSSTWHPTKRGIVLSAEGLDDLMVAATALKNAALQDRGVMPGNPGFP